MFVLFFCTLIGALSPSYDNYRVTSWLPSDSPPSTRSYRSSVSSGHHFFRSPPASICGSSGSGGSKSSSSSSSRFSITTTSDLGSSERNSAEPPLTTALGGDLYDVLPGSRLKSTQPTSIIMAKDGDYDYIDADPAADGHPGRHFAGKRRTLRYPAPTHRRPSPTEKTHTTCQNRRDRCQKTRVLRETRSHLRRPAAASAA